MFLSGSRRVAGLRDQAIQAPRAQQGWVEGISLGMLQMGTTIVYCGNIGIMEKKMEITVVYWG